MTPSGEQTDLPDWAGEHEPPEGDQIRNVLLFAATAGLVYLAAPVLYIGTTQTALFEQLGASKAISNLPSSIVLWLTPVPVLVAWYFPFVRALKPGLVIGYATYALMSALVVAALLLGNSTWVIAAVLAHAAVCSIANGAIGVFQWELLGRTVAPSRRGLALILAFGVGPALAALGSFGQQMVLGGLDPGATERGGDRWPFALIFAASVPMMILAAFLAGAYVLVPPREERPRQPFAAEVLGGLGEFVRSRLTLLTALAYFFIYCGYQSLPTMTLYTDQATGSAAAEYVGYQNMVRYGFKVVAGLLCGWLIARTGPKVGPLATGVMCLSAVAWVLAAPPGAWFLLSFGLMGAGELFDAYFRNYLVSCWEESRIRRNMAFFQMVAVPVGFAPVLYGWLVDTVGQSHGQLRGFQTAFLLALLMLVVSIGLICLLPRDPGRGAS